MGLDKQHIIVQPALRKRHTLWSQLVEPSIAIQNSEHRHQARLLSGLIFTLTIFLFIGLIASFITRKSAGIERTYIFALSLLLLFISYVISRTRYFYVASILALLTVSALPFSDVLIYPNNENITSTLMWLAIPIILGVTLLNPREFKLLVAIDIAGLVALAMTIQQSIFQLIIAGALILTISGILMLLEIYRRRIEENRQTELLKSNQELESIRTSLEDQVAERTRSAEQAKIEVESVNRKLEMQMWQVTGLAELAKVMQGVQSTSELATRIISQLCHYADIPVGALFIAENDELYLTGCYSYPFPTNPVPRFKLGYGLVGQAARDKQVITLRDIPENYLPITSGLGEIPPAQIIALPCVYQDRVIGVMELASQHPFTNAQILFITAATESIASALDTSHIRTQIDDLLIQSQQRTKKIQIKEYQNHGNIELSQSEKTLLRNEPQPHNQHIKTRGQDTDVKGANNQSLASGEVQDAD